MRMYAPEYERHQQILCSVFDHCPGRFLENCVRAECQYSNCKLAYSDTAIYTLERREGRKRDYKPQRAQEALRKWRLWDP
jgi:hypothetical protein